MSSNQQKPEKSHHRNKILEYSGSYAPTQGPQRAPPYHPAQGTKGAPPYQPIQTKKAPPYHPEKESTGPPPFHPTLGPPGPPPYGYPYKPPQKPKNRKHNEAESAYADSDSSKPIMKQHKLHGIHIHHHKAHKESN